MKKIIRHYIKNLIKIIFKNAELRNRLFSKFYAPENMKLGVSYSVWDGEELLEASIKSIKNQCDYINVVWQKTSWFGEPCNENLENHLSDLKNKGLIDEIIFFEPDTKLPAHVNEIRKRNLGLKYVQKAGCTHFLTMDTDEFYKEKEFEEAKKFITKFHITHSVCNIYRYPHINCRCSVTEEFLVPFIHKIDKHSKLIRNCCSPVPWYVDPTRQIPIDKFSVPCVLSNISMHHFSGVRKDLKRKLKNSSATLNEEKQNELIQNNNIPISELIAKGEGVWTENIFDINID